MFWYDYLYELECEREGQWTPWLTFALKYAVPPRFECQNTVAPTVYSLRPIHTFSTLLLEVKHVIAADQKGTGKSVYLSLWLQKDAPESIRPIFIHFSAQTHVNQLQNLLDSSFEKKIPTRPPVNCLFGS